MQKKRFSQIFNSCLSPLFVRARCAYLPFVSDYIGLGNRLKGLANFYSAGCHTLICLWNTKSWVTDRFCNLFSLEGIRVVEINNGILYWTLRKLLRRFLPIGLVGECHPFWSFILPQCFWRDKYRNRWSFAREDTFVIDFRFNEIDKDILDYYQPFFSRLKPSEKVLKRINSFAGDVKSLVGVQVRNTDVVCDEKGVCSIGTLMCEMDKFPGDQCFFVSAMNPKIEAAFRSRFGDRVSFLPDKNCGSMVDAVADMWLLGHCKAMIVSPDSTFSEIAWWWGGAQIPVKMMEEEYNQRNMCKDC